MDVFVLGSGFSKAVSQEMPVVAALVEPLATQLDITHAPLGDVLRQTGDIEAFFSYISDEQPWLDDSENAWNLSAFFSAVEWLCEHLYGIQQHVLGGPPPDWLLTLVEHWHLTRAPVVTLNYDLLVEASVSTLRLRMAHEGHGSYPDYRAVLPEPLPPLDARRNPAGRWVGPTRVKTLRLLKLHGSLNWAYSRRIGGGDAVYDTEGVDLWERESPHPWSAVHSSLRDLAPLVVPPIASKSSLFNQNGWMRTLWVEARKALDAATRVIVVGYSMPPSDTQTRLLLGPRVAERPLVIVNSDADCVAHYERMFPRSQVDTRFVGDHDCVPKFVGWYVSEGCDSRG